MTPTNPNSIVSVKNLQKARGYFNAFAMLMPILGNADYASTSIVENPEFYAVILDSEDKIIYGVRRDMTFTGLGTAEMIEAILEIIDDIENEE